MISLILFQKYDEIQYLKHSIRHITLLSKYPTVSISEVGLSFETKNLQSKSLDKVYVSDNTTM